MDAEQPQGWWTRWWAPALVGVIMVKTVFKTLVRSGWVEDQRVVGSLKWVEFVLDGFLWLIVIGGPVWARAGRPTRVLGSTLFGLYFAGGIAGALGFAGFLRDQGRTVENGFYVGLIVVVAVLAVALLVSLVRDLHEQTTRDVQARLRSRATAGRKPKPTGTA